MKELVKHKVKHNLTRLMTSIKWVVFAILSGFIVGGVGTLFYFCMSVVTLVRTKNPEIIFLLPAGGLVIVGLYRLLRKHRAVDFCRRQTVKSLDNRFVAQLQSLLNRLAFYHLGCH